MMMTMTMMMTAVAKLTVDNNVGVEMNSVCVSASSTSTKFPVPGDPRCDAMTTSHHQPDTSAICASGSTNSFTSLTRVLSQFCRQASQASVSQPASQSVNQSIKQSSN